MELKSKKYIKNTKQLPGFASGFNYSIISPAIDTLGNIYGTFNNYESADDLMAQTDTRTDNAGGVSYQYRTPVNTNEIESQANKKIVGGTVNGALKGAATGAMLGPVGALGGAIIGGLGSLFGGLTSKDKQMAEARKANIRLNNSNNFNLAVAMSQNQQMENARKGYTNQGQVLSGYSEGKPVYSAAGLVDENATARVSNGEVIGNFKDGYVSRVPGKKNNKDTKLANIKDDDFVITNKHGLSDYAAATGDYVGALNMQNMLMNYKNGKKPCCKNGKLPKLVNGQLLNGIGAGIGALGGIYQFFDARNQSIKNPHTYVDNPYANEVIGTLGNLRMSSLPIANKYLSAEARANDAIRNSGGLTTGQRMLSRIAALNGTQANIGQLLTANQAQNNAYATQYANALATLGQHDRQARMQANQWDLDYYSKAHAARQQGMQMGMYNTINHVLEGLKGAYNIDMYNRTYNLYADEQERKKAETQAYIDNLKGSKSTTAKRSTVAVPTVPASITNTNTWIGPDGKLYNANGVVSSMPINDDFLRWVYSGNKG